VPDRRWNVELRVSRGPVLSSPTSAAASQGGAIRALVGYRLTEDWKLEGAVGIVGLDAWRSFTPGVGGTNDTNFAFGDPAPHVAFGGAWTPSRYFSVAARLGLASAKVAVDEHSGYTGASGSDSATNIDPTIEGEVRLDYPLGAWSVGARLGILAIYSQASLDVPTTAAKDFSPGFFVLMPISAAVSYRF
jgi:hypothetical protein